MNIGFFIVGAVIFAIYMGLTIYNIIYSNRKQRENNYPKKSSDRKGLWFEFLEIFYFKEIKSARFLSKNRALVLILKFNCNRYAKHKDRIVVVYRPSPLSAVF